MNLSALFIRRPATTTLLKIGLMVFGVMAYRQLPVSDPPAVDFPSIPDLTGMNSTRNQGSTSTQIMMTTAAAL